MINLAVVVPCFNEQEALPVAAMELLSLLDDLEQKKKITSESQLWFVDDGSRDKTWQLIEGFAHSDNRVHGLKLLGNHGQQRALLAGLLTVDADAVITIDVDLQDPISVIEEMIDVRAQGKDVVYGVRKDRQSDSFWKRNLARGYYRLLKLLGIDIVSNHADFRLLSRRTLESLKNFEEVNIFLRGLIPTMSYSSGMVEYDRQDRVAGKSKYSYAKMISLAVDGITSFSAAPLRFIALTGVLIFFGSLMLTVWALWVRLFSDDVLPGWASSVLPMYFLGGVQLFSIGIVGEYVSKIYLESKRRPRFLIDKRI